MVNIKYPRRPVIYSRVGRGSGCGVSTVLTIGLGVGAAVTPVPANRARNSGGLLIINHIHNSIDSILILL
jgi:hypothetical protein